MIFVSFHFRNMTVKKALGFDSIMIRLMNAQNRATIALIWVPVVVIKAYRNDTVDRIISRAGSLDLRNRANEKYVNFITLKVYLLPKNTARPLI